MSPGMGLWTVVRGGARGLVAAMAMTGIRTVTAAVGPHERTPPEAIVEKHAPSVRRLPKRYQEAVTELAHWTYGAVGGAAFGALPRRLRTHPLTGPAYGLVIWAGFETVIAPALGVRHAREHGVLWRAVLALDHIIYGIVVADRSARERSLRGSDQPGHRGRLDRLFRGRGLTKGPAKR